MFKEIPLNQIKPGRFQPRQEFDPEKLLDLASSIQEEGLLYPLLVFLDEDNRYELIGGERRWRAVCAVKLANIGEFDGGLADAVAITAGPDQFQAGPEAREIILNWYEMLASSDKRNFVFSVLGWLPSGAPTKTTLPKLWDQYTEPEVLALLHIGIHEARASHWQGFSLAHIMLVAPNGQSAKWKPLDWNNFVSKNTPYNWDDWPKPWAVRPADT